MTLKWGGLLVIALLAVFSQGCAMMGPGSVPLDLCRPSDASFTQDTSPALPNFYWVDR